MTNHSNQAESDWFDFFSGSGLTTQEAQLKNRNIWKEARKAFLLYHPRPYSFWADGKMTEAISFESQRRIRDPVWIC